jgi:hypothetical protein
MSKKQKSSDPFLEDRKRNDTLNKAENKKKEGLPGDYPPDEDIMNRRDTQRIGLDVEIFLAPRDKKFQVTLVNLSSRNL